jgi:hypothetical protein
MAWLGEFVCACWLGREGGGRKVRDVSGVDNVGAAMWMEKHCPPRPAQLEVVSVARVRPRGRNDDDGAGEEVQLILFFFKKKAGVPKKRKLCPTISLDPLCLPFPTPPANQVLAIPAI